MKIRRGPKMQYILLFLIIIAKMIESRILI